MTKLKARIKNPAIISVPLDQCLNCGQHINQIQDGLHNVDSPKSSTAVVAFDSFVQNSRTQVFMRDALKEIYSLLYLVQLNQDSDGCALCVDCCLVFAQLYGLFHTFESRRKSDGFLGSTLKLAFKSVAAGSWTVANGAAQEIDSDEEAAGHHAAMETDPSDSFIEIQGFSSEETSDADVSEGDEDDVEMSQTFDTPPSPDSASDQDVEMPEDFNSGPASPLDLDPASPINSSPASPIDNDTASQVKSEPEPEPEQLNPLEPPVSPPASPGAPKNLKPKPVWIFKCIDCAKQFESATELGTHRKKAHKAEYPFACHLCSYKTKNGTILKPHLIRHSASYGLKCKICKRMFILKNDLRRHLRKKHKMTNFITEHYMEGETPVQNRIRKSSARGQINEAVAFPTKDVASGESNSSSDSDNDDEESPKKPKSKPVKPPNKSVQVAYKCTDCPEEFTDLPVFAQHRQKIHNKSGSEVYKCHCCSRLFGQGNKLNLHLTRKALLHAKIQAEDTNNYLFKCIDCAKPFKGATELGTHRVKAHKAEYPFACHLCPYKTKNNSILKPHVARHSAPWNLKCKICKRLFRLKNDLRHHLRKTHKLTNFITEHYMEGETPVPSRIRKSSARGQINVAEAFPTEDVVAGTSQDVKSEDKSKNSEESPKKSEESSKKCDENSRNSDDSESDEDPNSKGSSEMQVDASANDDNSDADSDSSSSSYGPSVASNASSDSENDDDEESPEKPKPKPVKPPNKSIQVTYKCTDCPEEFTNLPVFTQHRQKIHEKSGSQIYKCHCCFKLFGQGNRLTLHLTRQAIHAKNGGEDMSNYLFQCVDCSQKCKSPAALGRHRKDVHNSENLYVCHFCHYTTPNSSILKPHILRHIVTATHKCPMCDRYFKLKADVQGHMRKTHKIRRIVQRSIHNEPGKPTVMINRCKKCDKEFESQQDLIQHRKIVHGDNEAFHCDICAAVFFSKHNLNNHKARHTSEPKHKCSHCDKTFYESSAKKLHEETIHSLKPLTEKAAFKCPNCRMSFGSVEGLEAHHESKHIGAKRKGTFVCDQCGMPFESKIKLRVHMDRRHKSLKCPHCDLKIASRELTVHIKAKHPDKYGPYSKKKAKEIQSSGVPAKDVELHCCNCAAIFPTVFSLRHHCQDEHGTPDDEIMTCHLCKQVYRQEIVFVTHVGEHNEGSDWPCAHCSMRFTRRRHRNLHHVRDHGIEDDKDAMFPLPPTQELECLQGSSSTGDAGSIVNIRTSSSDDPKPYKCLECDAEFLRAIQLGIHRTVAHGCKNEERYQCHICHQFYKTDGGLWEHMTRHGERDKLCEICGKGFKAARDLVQHYQLNHTEDGSKHLRAKWKRWRVKKSKEVRAKRAGRKVDESESDTDE